MRHARRDVLAFALFDASRFFGHALPILLLAGDRLGRALAGAGVGVRPLTADRQALAETQATVTGQVHQPPDVHGRLAAKVAFDAVVAVDRLADLQHFGIGQLIDPARIFDAHLVHDLLGFGLADAMDVLQRDDDALVSRNVDACDTGHA